MWAAAYTVVLDVACLTFLVALLVGAGIFMAMVNSLVWPGSEAMAMIVKADWVALGVSLWVLLLLFQIGPARGQDPVAA